MDGKSPVYNGQKPSNEFWLKFIQCYKSEPCLWQTSSSTYGNRHHKQQAYDRLLDILRTRMPSANVDSVKRKINSLRDNFRQEHEKVIASRENGTCSDGMYKPSLWSFPHLLFLVDQESPEVHVPDTDDECEHNGKCTPLEELSHCESECSPPTSRSERSLSALRKKRKSNTNVAPELNNGIKRKAVLESFQTDEYDFMAKVWAAKLKKLPEKMQLIVEKRIGNIFFEAQMDTLSMQNTNSST